MLEEGTPLIVPCGSKWFRRRKGALANPVCVWGGGGVGTRPRGGGGIGAVLLEPLPPQKGLNQHRSQLSCVPYKARVRPSLCIFQADPCSSTRAGKQLLLPWG